MMKLKIYIHVNGEQKRDYFSVILFILREINKSFEKLTYDEKILIGNKIEITISYKHLIKLESRGIERYLPEGSQKEYNVKDLLGSIYVKNKSEKEILRILRKLKSESDSVESLLKKAEDAVILQPNFMGMGVDLKKLIKKILKKIKKIYDNNINLYIDTKR